ncbi:MAG: DUF1192 domain-containing protein [Hyphomicrobiaceae bacterium]
MDWDEPRARQGRSITVGDDLSAQSLGELEQRIAALEAEIVRTRAEVAVKKARQSAAADLFKS